MLERWKNNFYSNRRACPYIRKLGTKAMKKIIFTRTEGHALIFELWAPLPNFRLYSIQFSIQYILLHKLKATIFTIIITHWHKNTHKKVNTTIKRRTLRFTKRSWYVLKEKTTIVEHECTKIMSYVQVHNVHSFYYPWFKLRAWHSIFPFLFCTARRRATQKKERYITKDDVLSSCPIVQSISA